MSRVLRWLWERNPAVRSAVETRIRRAVDAAMVANPRHAATFHPHAPERASYLVAATGAPSRDDATELPVPPRELWWDYAETAERYLALGAELVESMKQVLQDAGTPLDARSRVLDFGCGSGLMIRWLADVGRGGEAWGVDISADHVLWCQQHLSPPFRFVTTTSFPHLPFEDGYFDFVYAGSVFSHIADLADAWLLELRRIVRPGGRLYVTVQDERCVELCMQGGQHPPLAAQLRAWDAESHFTETAWDYFTINRAPGQGGPGQAQVFYRSDWLRRHWGRYLTIVSYTRERYGNQSAVLLAK